MAAHRAYPANLRKLRALVCLGYALCRLPPIRGQRHHISAYRQAWQKHHIAVFIPADIHRIAFKAEGGRQAHGLAAAVGKQFGRT